MNRDKQFESWIANYECAWRTEGTAALDELFSSDAEYSPAPFEAPLIGRAAIAKFWDAERVSPEEAFSFRADVIAVDGATAVARVYVDYEDEVAGTYKDLWIIVLNAEGRCTHFEEWPSFDGQPRVAPGGIRT